MIAKRLISARGLSQKNWYPSRQCARNSVASSKTADATLTAVSSSRRPNICASLGTRSKISQRQSRRGRFHASTPCRVRRGHDREETDKCAWPLAKKLVSQPSVRTQFRRQQQDSGRDANSREQQPQTKHMRLFGNPQQNQSTSESAWEISR